MAFAVCQQFLEGGLTTSGIAQAMHVAANMPPSSFENASVLDLLVQVRTASQHRLNEFAPADLAILAFSIAKVLDGARQLRHSQVLQSTATCGSIEDFVVEIASVARNKVTELSPSATSNLAVALAKAKVLGDGEALEFVSAAAEQGLTEISNWPPKAVSNFCYVLGQIPQGFHKGSKGCDAKPEEVPVVPVKLILLSGSTLASLQVPASWSIGNLRHIVDDQICRQFCSVGDLVQVQAQASECIDAGIVACLKPLQVNNAQTAAAMNADYIAFWKARAQSIIFNGCALGNHEYVGTVFKSNEENVVQVTVGRVVGANFAEAVCVDLAVGARIAAFNWQDLGTIIASLARGGFVSVAFSQTLTQVVTLAAGHCHEMTTQSMLCIAANALEMGIARHVAQPMVADMAGEIARRAPRVTKTDLKICSKVLELMGTEF